MKEFDYYNFNLDARGLDSVCRWLSVIRCFCAVKTPANIYSNLEFPVKHFVKRNFGAIAVPEIVSNILSEMLERYRAREAYLGELDDTVRDVLVESGVLHRGAWRCGDKWYMVGGVWRVSAAAVGRFGELLVEAVHVETRYDVESIRRALVRAAAVIDRGHMTPAPLYDDEVKWLAENGWTWRSAHAGRDG